MQLVTEPDKARPAVRQVMRYWQQDSDLAVVRGEALAKLPEAERQAWQKLWEGVAALLRRAEENRRYWEERNRPVFERNKNTPPTPEQATRRARLEELKAGRKRS